MKYSWQFSKIIIGSGPDSGISHSTNVSPFWYREAVPLNSNIAEVLGRLEGERGGNERRLEELTERNSKNEASTVQSTTQSSFLACTEQSVLSAYGFALSS